MPYENVYRTSHGHLKLPFADLPLLLQVNPIRISEQERQALENMYQLLQSVMILAGRLRSHLSRYGENKWVNVPFEMLFLDTQSVVLFLRQFMEDVAFVVRAVIPAGDRYQMPEGFTDLAKRIRAADPEHDEQLAAIFPASDPFRQFLIVEEPWLQGVKDLRDDICHRTSYGRLRTATFPSLIDLIRAGGGGAPFASEADLRAYLCGLFQRWLALAWLASEFFRRRVREDHPETPLPMTDDFIVREGEFDFITVSDPLFPPGATIQIASAADLEGLEYFLTYP